MNRLGWVVVLAGLVASAGCGGRSDKTFTVAFVPKIKGIPYFLACEKGAQEAADELKIKLVYDGPTQADSNPQIELLNNRIDSGEYDCLAVACTERDRVAPVLKKARKRGLSVVTFDADTRPEARQFFVNMASYDAVAAAMVDALVAELGPGPKGKVGILTSSLEAPNQAEWARRIKAIIGKKWPGLEVLPEVTHGEDRNEGVRKARALVQANRDKGLVGIIGLTSVAVPAAAEAVRQEKLVGKIQVTGVSTPRDMRDYVKGGVVQSFILWSPVDLGYLTVQVCNLVRLGKMPEDGTIDAGRLKGVRVTDREVLLGPPIKFTKENIDKYDF
jgi:ABC-type sugar transport system substrate-binding protein